MSFDVTRWPLADDVDHYQRDLKIPRDAIVRDIARLVTVAQMVSVDSSTPSSTSAASSSRSIRRLP